MRLNFLGNENGVTMIEWTLLAALVISACITAMSLVGIHSDDTFTFIMSAL